MTLENVTFKNIKYSTDDGKLEGNTYFDVTVVIGSEEIPYTFLDIDTNTSEIDTLIRSALKENIIVLPKITKKTVKPQTVNLNTKIEFENNVNETTNSINNAYNYELQNGYIGYLGKDFSINEQNVLLLLSLKNVSTKSLVKVKDNYNNDCTLDIDEIPTILNLIINRRTALKQYYDSLISKIENATESKDLENITWTYDDIQLVIDSTNNEDENKTLDELKEQSRRRFTFERAKEIAELTVEFTVKDVIHSIEACDYILTNLNTYISMNNEETPISDVDGEILELSLAQLVELRKLIIEARENVIIKYSYYFNAIKYAETDYDLAGLV